MMRAFLPRVLSAAGTLALLLTGAPGGLTGQTYRVDAVGDLTGRDVRIVQTNSAGTEVHVFDPSTLELVGVVDEVTVPHGAALDADGRYYYVTNEHDATVDVVDTRTLRVVRQIPLAARPNNLSGSDRARKIYVAITAEPLVQVISMDSHEVIKDIPTNGGVHNTFVTPDGRYAVSGTIGSSTLMAVDTETDEVVWEKRTPFQQNPFTGGMRPFTFTTHPDGSTRWILVNVGGWHGFWVLDWETQEVLRKVEPPADAWSPVEQTADGIQSATSHGIVVLPDQSAVWVSSRGTSHIYGWSLPDFRYLGRVWLGNPAWLTATPDSRQVWVGVASHGETAVVDVRERRVVRRFPVGQTPKRIYTAVFPEGWEGEAPEAARNVEARRGLDFQAYRETVEPIFLRPRGGYVGSDAACVACHTWQTTTPFDLETPLVEDGRAYWTEAQSRRNFAMVSRLVDPSDVESSRLLRAVLAPAEGGRRHSGGVFWTSRDDPEWRAIAEWVGAAPADAVSPAPAPELDFAFYQACVQPVFVTPPSNGVACVQCHAAEFARPLPAGGARDEASSRAALEALMQFLEPGYPEYSRFLHKPLHPDGGGDFMHNGIRRWQSKHDPEWRALAAWVRGDARGSTCPAALRFPAASH